MNVRLSILLIAVLVLIGGSVLMTVALRTKEPKELQDWMYRVDMEDINSVSVIHKDEQVDYALEGDQWVIKGGEETPVFRDKWGGKILLLSGPRSSRTLADEIDDPSKYGLDSPQMKVQLVLKSGQLLNFQVGDPTPDKQNWYAQLVGSEKLFTVAGVWGEEIARLVTEPPYPPPIYTVTSVEGLVSIIVTHKDERVEYALEDDQWVIKDGSDTPVSKGKWADTLLLLGNPKDSRTLNDKIDAPANYGLDPPQTTVQIVDENDFELAFHLGEPTSDGENWYARLLGSDRLFTVTSAWGEEISRLATNPP